MLKAIELTQRLASGKVASPIIDIYAKKYKPNKIKFDTSNIKRYLGIEISVSEIKKILESLGFIVSGKKIMNITVPCWRANDVQFDYDLIEEVARIYGYHNLPTELPEGRIPLEEKNSLFFWENKIKDLLCGLGFSESFNYSMVSDSLLRKIGFSGKEAIKIDNPLNEDMQYLRTTLMPGILQNVSDNLSNFPELKIFELSNIYLKIKENDLPSEISKLTGAVVCNEETFLQAKGVVEFLLKKLGILEYELRPTDPVCPLWEKCQCLDVYKDKVFLGQFGLVKNDILEKFGIKKSVAIFDFEIPVLLEFATTVKSFQMIPEFPSVVRDLAIIVDEKVSWQEIKNQVNQVNQLITKVEYLNTFISKDLPIGKKSLALRLTFRDAGRTLKSEEVDVVVEKVIKILESSFGAKLR
jgi:phenylalanyl-tRNA synthetase beta chain